jgi:hypothetical protein
LPVAEQGAHELLGPKIIDIGDAFADGGKANRHFELPRDREQDAAFRSAGSRV